MHRGPRAHQGPQPGLTRGPQDSPGLNPEVTLRPDARSFSPSRRSEMMIFDLRFH